MHNAPADMAPFYAGGYDEIPATLDELRAISVLEPYRSELILKYKKSGRYLELGPWRGVMCCQMKDAGFEVTAIEMNHECVEYLHNVVGITAIQSTNPAETMMGLEPGFDVIAAWHSLEHLPHPWVVIQQAARLLNPGGILLLAMPNPESYEFSALKGAWMHLDAPRHLYFFSLRCLAAICDKYMLRPLEMTTADKFSNIQHWHAWRNFARSWVPIRYVRGVLGLVFTPILCKLASKKQSREGLGSAYTAAFVKED